VFTLLDVDPTLAGFGQTAAIIIALFFLVFILITAALALAMVFATAWIREKSELIKMLRPTVDSVNKTTEAAIQGQEPEEDKHAIIRTIAKVPASMHTADKKVDEVTDKVAHGAIEFRARMLQVQTVATAFLFPKTMTRQNELPTTESVMELHGAGYREVTKEKALTATMSDQANGHAQPARASPLQDAPLR
jgi:hypothetical protein